VRCIMLLRDPAGRLICPQESPTPLRALHTSGEKGLGTSGTGRVALLENARAPGSVPICRCLARQEVDLLAFRLLKRLLFDGN